MINLRFAFHQLLKNPGFAAVVLLTPAPGIAFNLPFFRL